MKPPSAPPAIGAIQKTQSWLMAQPSWNKATPVERAGFRNRNAHKVDQGQAQANGQRSHAGRCILTRGTNDDQQEYGRQNNLRNDHGSQRIALWRIFAIPIRRKAAGTGIKARLA